MSGDALVSVIIPTFNRAHVLAQAINSVLKQTYKTLELIVVDDGSIDDTENLIGAFDDPRLIYLKSPQNYGVSAARNRGIAAARGEWLAFLDSDDEWLPQMLERQFVALDQAEPGYVACYCDMLRLDNGHATRIPRKASEKNFGAAPWPSLLMDGEWFSQTWLVKKDTVLAAGGFDERMQIWEDWDLFLRIALQGSIHHLPEVLVHSTVSPDSLVGRHENRPASLRVLQQKHAALFARDAAVAAHHAYTCARFELLYGDWFLGSRRLLTVICMEPGRPRGWALLLASLSGRAGLQHLAQWAKRRKEE